MPRKTRKTSQVISTIAIGSMLLSSTAAFASPSPDVPTNVAANVDDSTHWAAKELQKWSSIGLLKGDANGNLNPNEAITRAEFVTILNRVFNLQSTVGSKTFADANPGDWYYTELQKASAAGLLNGDASNNANPNAAITRQEAAALISRGFQVITGTKDIEFSDSSKIAGWALEAVSALASKGYLNGRGNGNFDPHANITRAESFVMTDRVMGTLVRTAEDLANLPSTIVGNVTIALPGAVLKGLTITGDVYVTDAAASEPVVLDHTAVKGDLSLVSAKGVNLIASTVTGTTNVTDTHHTLALNLDADSTLNVLTLNTPSNVTGTGSIQTANIKSAGVTIAQQPANVNVAAGITSTVAGKTVEGTTSTPDTPVIPPITGGGTAPTPIVPAVSTGTTVDMHSTQITRLQPAGLIVTEPIQWTTSDPYVAYVDTIGNSKGNYAGKVLGVTEGTATITGKQGAVTVTVTVTVKNDPNLAKETNLEKIVYYYNAGDATIPAALSSTAWSTTNIPAAPEGKTFPSKTYAGYVEGEKGVKWLVSKDTLIKSTSKVVLGNETTPVTIGIVSDAVTLYDPNLASADQIQYLQGGRYIPQTGVAGPATGAEEVITNIMPDGKNGLWILGAAGNATHIVRKPMSLMAKSLVQEEISRNFADRFGFQSGAVSFSTQADMIKAAMNADKGAGAYIGDTDNDGLWTTMYASGEIWRYNYMKKTYGDADARTIDARASATRAVESIVTLGYVSGMQLKVPSKANVNDPSIYTVLGANPNGSDEGKPVYIDAATGNYTLTAAGNAPASAGFFARSYKVANKNNGATLADGNPGVNSAWLQKKAGTTTDINGTTVNYSTPSGALKAYDTVAVPSRLVQVYAALNGGDTENNLDSSNVYYKATTSTDELVGHYFTLDLAYSAFKDSDPELAALIKNDMINHTNAVILNNYYQVSVTGENPVESRFNPADPIENAAKGNGLNYPSVPTKWANMNPEFLDGVSNAWGRNDYEDGPLNATLALQMLAVAKDMGNYTQAEQTALAAQGVTLTKPLDYANELNVMNGDTPTGAKTAHNDYETRYPKTHFSTSLLDMSLDYLSRYFGISAHNGNGMGESGTSYQSYLNYSDEEEAALAYYTLAHHTDATHAGDILAGMNQWWFHEKRQKNPFVTTFYAASLGALKNKSVNIGNPTVDLAGSTWQMTRIPNNFMNWDVLSANRNDVTHVIPDGMVDQLIPRDEVMMSKYNTNIFGTMDRRTIDSGFSRSMESSTVISMPYWLTMNPNDAANVAALGQAVTAPVNKGTESLTYPTNVEAMNPNGNYDAATHTFTINVGDSVRLDAKTTGYIRSVSWLTDAWHQAGYVDGKPAPINADPSKFQVIDLRDLAAHGEVGNVDATGISVAGEYTGAYATGLKPGTVTVTAYVIDGFFRTPKTLTYTINVVDPKASAAPASLTAVTASNFAYPAWLTAEMAKPNLNTDGNPFVEVSYRSSSEADGTVDPVTGEITYLTNNPFTIIATVAYSDTTVNADPDADAGAWDDLGARFEEDSHVMTFECPVSNTSTPIVDPVTPVTTGTTISMYSTQITRLQPEGFNLTLPIQWTTSDPYVAYVDTIGNTTGNNAGKVLGISAGTATITGKQGASTVTVKVTVHNDPSLATNLEKIVYYYSAGDALIPNFTAATLTTDTVAAPAGKAWPSASYAGYVDGTNGVKWMLASDKKSVTLYDPNASNPLDQIQYLQGTRYIPILSPLASDEIASILSDNNGGLWIRGVNGDVTHIVRKQMSLMAKTLLLDEVGRNLNDRLGFQSGTARFNTKEDMYAAVNGSKDQSDIARSLGSTDNDGLWTTMYGAGELYRYNYMKATYGADDARTKDALASATRSVESDLLLSFISQRQLKVPAASNVNNPAIYDLLGANPDGSEEGYPVYLNADGTFTLENTGTPAPDGFVSRSYYAFDDAQYGNAAFLASKLNDKERWMEIASGTTVDINGTEVNYAKPYDVTAFSTSTYDYNSLKAYATVPVPQRLADTFDIAGKHIFYKDTTSTDEMIGHLYFLDMAYKTFKDVDPELASLAKTAITNVTNHIIINNYYFVGVAPQQKNGNPVVPLLPEYRKDLNGTPGAKYSAGYAASGNGLNVPSTPTRWSYYNPEYMDGNVNAWGLSDYEDASLGAILDLTMLQQGQNFVADSSIPLYTGAADGYKTAKIGIIDYVDEFNVLTNPAQYKARFPKVRNSNTIADVASQYHNRYFGISEHDGSGVGEDGTTFENYLNYSDEEMAALGFAGLIASANANTTPALKQEYLKGLNQWWYNEKRTNNPFLSYFYAMSLGQLQALGVDVSGNQVDLAGADWQMHRIPSNFLNVTVSNAGRSDLTNNLPSDDYDQLLPRDEAKTAKYNTNWLNPNASRGDYSMEASTGISLPYWLSVDPTNKALISSLGNSITSVTSRVTGDISIPSNLTQTITLNVGEQLDLSVTGQENSYIKNISWSTDAWDDSTPAYQVVDLRTGESTTNFDGKTYGSVVTARKAGMATVTAWTADGGAAAPRTVTFTINVVDPNAAVAAVQLNQVTAENFALPVWLAAAIADLNKNTDGNAWVTVTYSSSSDADGSVDADTGVVSYHTSNAFNVIATVTYSDMTLNGEPMFEADSHVMTFVCQVQQQTP
ncbi:S-layer homology domain-containing protein [Paenibacillus lignilyticus]|uniref:S-layer homology domain-containing protein n=1 Tax=Paenibacillus lignilyticus TaxID=1172615 RepID=A0ABS5C9P7_9BACL|nr:S-layer homology domain-containing protein [Paenibacillus lignilyticus]MBP3962550.1 S-layer homology domain-containing protein [Paenibacillus lignilyticus]